MREIEFEDKSSNQGSRNEVDIRVETGTIKPSNEQPKQRESFVTGRAAHAEPAGAGARYLKSRQAKGTHHV
jgi:hypothetical protein